MESRISLTPRGLALLARLKLVSLTQRRVEGLPVGSAHCTSAERARPPVWRELAKVARKNPLVAELQANEWTLA